MYARDGRMLGGNSAFAHIGSYEKRDDDSVDIVIQTVRHNPDPNYRAMAGTDDATLLAKGRADGALYRFEGGLKELPGTPYRSPAASARVASSTASIPFTSACLTVSRAA